MRTDRRNLSNRPTRREIPPYAWFTVHVGINTSITALCLVSKPFPRARVFSLPIPCSGLHLETGCLQRKHLSRYASEKQMDLCTQRCVQSVFQAQGHRMRRRAPRTCSPRGMGVPEGTGGPRPHGSPPASPGQWSRASARAAVGLPAPRGPRGHHPSAPHPAGVGRPGPAAPRSACGACFLFKACAAPAQPPRRRAGRRRGAGPAEPPRRAAAAAAASRGRAPLPRRPLPRAPARPPGAGRSGLFCCAAVAAAGLASSFVPGWSPFLSPQCWVSEPLAAPNRLALSLSNSFYLLPQFLSPLAPFPRARLPPPPAACAPAPPPRREHLRSPPGDPRRAPRPRPPAPIPRALRSPGL